MRMIEKESFIKSSLNTLGEIYDILIDAKSIKLEELESKNTALVIIDMINGFAREGALKSPRVEAIIPNITKLMRKCDELSIEKLAFGDCHTDASPEFAAYPSHCKLGTTEAEIVDEIKEAGGYKFISKNSTNGFLEEGFGEWLNSKPEIDTFIITGDCTDICVQQFAITLKTWFNMQDKGSRIIVPMDSVDTYDLGMHNAELMNVMALYNMMGNGIEVAKKIS